MTGVQWRAGRGARSATRREASGHTLASLFFSGFFLATDRLVYPAHIISWLLPATFGIQLLRDVMLRGTDLDAGTLAALGGYAAVVVALSYMGTRRLLRAH